MASERVPFGKRSPHLVASSTRGGVIRLGTRLRRTPYWRSRRPSLENQTGDFRPELRQALVDIRNGRIDRTHMPLSRPWWVAISAVVSGNRVANIGSDANSRHHPVVSICRRERERDVPYFQAKYQIQIVLVIEYWVSVSQDPDRGVRTKRAYPVVSQCHKIWGSEKAHQDHHATADRPCFARLGEDRRARVP